jgi:SAM-dependent methyltransferase
MSWLEKLNVIRDAEIARIETFLVDGARVLEIGAGTGRQANYLSGRGYEVDAIDVATSGYVQDRQFPVRDYDGRTIPFPDASFDVIFSSNVMEHVRDLPEMNREIARVLRPGGYAVHVMPTHVWQFWTLLAVWPATPSALFDIARRRRIDGDRQALAARLIAMAKRVAVNFWPMRHGEKGFSAFSELWLFRPQRWILLFQSCGYDVAYHEPLGLFYTGHLLCGGFLTVSDRQWLAKRLGSACHIYWVVPHARGGRPEGRL